MFVNQLERNLNMQRRNDFTPLVPFMPKEPKMYHAYVPYQLDVEEYDLDEALEKGSLYEVLYSPFCGNVGGGERLC